MAMTINTNIASLNAQRNLGKTQNMLNKSLQRLSSGLRINSAKDDAAGLAIANRMMSQIRGLDQAVRNANDGISLAQTAEGALQESGNILQRIRELAIQSSSDGSTDTDRASMQIEVALLISELDRIADTTSFNGQVLLDGTFGSARFQVGAEAGEYVSMSMTSAKTNSLGATGGVSTGDFTMASETSTASSLTTWASTGSLATLGANELSINGTNIRAALSGDDTISTSDNSASSIAIAAAINVSSSITGVSAYAEQTTFNLGSVTTSQGALGANDFEINGVQITGGTMSGASDVAATGLAAVINAFSSETGVGAAVNGTDEVIMTAIDGRNIEVEVDGGATFVTGNFTSVDALHEVMRGTVSLYSNEAFTIAGSNPGDVGLTAGIVALDSAHWTSVAGHNTLVLGDLVINGYNVIAPTATGDQYGNERSNEDTVEAASAKAIAYAINNTSGLKEEVVATATTVANFGTVSAETSKLLAMVINGETVAINQEVVANDADGFIVGTMNAAFGAATAATADYGLVASMNSDNELIITSSTGANIDVDISAGSTASIFSATGMDSTDGGLDVAHKGTISLAGTSGNQVSSITGGKQALAGIETAVGTLENVSVATYAGAQNAITAVDGALAQVDDQRAVLGAMQNRFDSTIANLSTTSENLSAARARVMDADFAAETAALTKAQILQQAGVAMLAQANTLPQAALSLLQ